MRALSVVAGVLCSISFAPIQAFGQSSTNVSYGPFTGSCSNNTLWTDAFADQDDLDFWNALQIRTTDLHRLNGTAITVPGETRILDPNPGVYTTYLSFCPNIAPNLVGNWRRESFLALMYASCWPGFENPPDPNSNPNCWWSVECFGGGEPCVDIGTGFID